MRAQSIAQGPAGLLMLAPLAIGAFLILTRNPDVVVLFPPEGLVAMLPEGTEIVSETTTELTLAGGSGLTEALRAAGATIVLKAGRGGCAKPELP